MVFNLMVGYFRGAFYTFIVKAVKIEIYFITRGIDDELERN